MRVCYLDCLQKSNLYTTCFKVFITCDPLYLIYFTYIYALSIHGVIRPANTKDILCEYLLPRTQSAGYTVIKNATNPQNFPVFLKGTLSNLLTYNTEGIILTYITKGIIL